MDPASLDGIISRLLEVKGTPGRQVQMSEGEIRQLCGASKEIFLQQPNLLELEAPIKICGIKKNKLKVLFSSADTDFFLKDFLNFRGFFNLRAGN